MSNQNINEAKAIIAHFLKIPSSEINKLTVIDHTVIPSSLLLHRMYAVLTDNGFTVDDPASITTYGDFVKNILKKTERHPNKDILKERIVSSPNEDGLLIGVDIEEIRNFELMDNYKDDPFYKSNYSLQEISYCKSRANPISSFAGLFALKEAIIKADNSYKGVPFYEIEIMHTNTGKPVFSDFSISLSHSDSYVVAVVCKLSVNNKGNYLFGLNRYAEEDAQKKIINNNKFFIKLAIIAIFIFIFIFIFYKSVI